MSSYIVGTTPIEVETVQAEAIHAMLRLYRSPVAIQPAPRHSIIAGYYQIDTYPNLVVAHSTNYWKLHPLEYCIETAQHYCEHEYTVVDLNRPVTIYMFDDTKALAGLVDACSVLGLKPNFQIYRGKTELKLG